MFNFWLSKDIESFEEERKEDERRKMLYDIEELKKEVAELKRICNVDIASHHVEHNPRVGISIKVADTITLRQAFYLILEKLDIRITRVPEQPAHYVVEDVIVKERR